VETGSRRHRISDFRSRICVGQISRFLLVGIITDAKIVSVLQINKSSSFAFYVAKSLISATEQIFVPQPQARIDGIIGKPLKRKEDPRFLTGMSKYVDDMKLPGMLYASVVRSPYARAKISNLNVMKAENDSRVRLVYTGEQITKRLGYMPVVKPVANRKPAKRPVLAYDSVRHQGEAIAFLVADSRYDAEDVVELVEADYVTLQAVTDPVRALNEDSPLVHEELGSNMVNHYVRSAGDVDRIFRSADRIIKLDIVNQRITASPIEPRGILASYDKGSDILTVWMGTQCPYEIRTVLSEILKIDDNKLRVIAPDIGGGFGAKFAVYPEDILVCLASIDLGRPVKWIESRSENFVAMTHARGQRHHIEAAVRNDGKILGLKAKIISDTGAYPTEEAVVEPEITVDMMTGAYDVECFSGELFCALTNKVPLDAYRGAGRPEATYLIERTVHRISSELGLDPAEIRIRNFVEPDRFPFRTLAGYSYDSGNYEMNLRKALELADYTKWRIRQRRVRSLKDSTKLIGIGLSTYVEICAFGPDFPQTASIVVNASGKVTIVSGTSPHGQGHETPFAQIVANELGIPLEDIVVNFGNTVNLAYGTFTAGSRSAALGGTAVLMCAKKIKEKMKVIVANELDVDPIHLEFRDGLITHDLDSSKSISFKDAAALAYQPSKLPLGTEPTLFAYSAYAPSNYTFPFGTHIAVVEIDSETGRVNIVDYIAVDDCGKVLNEMIVQGQVQGGLVQGTGQALLEEIVYDEAGQLLTSSFIDYQLPLAQDSFPIRWQRTETPSPVNPLGIKGIGEAGAIAAPPTIVNAVEDALLPFGVQIDSMPLKLDSVFFWLNRRHRENLPR
jgi:carbon-monoxide dehydrogenase large subunit